MGLFDFFRKKTDDEIEAEELSKAQATLAQPGTSGNINLPQNVLDEVMNLLHTDKKIQAIKLVKDTANVGLAEAMNYVNDLIPTPSAESVEGEARRLVQEGKTMEAIRMVNDTTHMGLKNAKEFVERLQ